MEGAQQSHDGWCVLNSRVEQGPPRSIPREALLGSKLPSRYAWLVPLGFKPIHDLLLNTPSLQYTKYSMEIYAGGCALICLRMDAQACSQ